MQTVKTAVLILLCTSLLGACGLKGPLYLPEETPASGQATAPGKDAEKDEEKKKDNNSGQESPDR